MSIPQNNSGVFRSNLTVRNRIDREQYHEERTYKVAVQVSQSNVKIPWKKYIMDNGSIYLWTQFQRDLLVLANRHALLEI